MYIRDSSFYDVVRDTTELNVFFLKPRPSSILYCDFGTAVYDETLGTDPQWMNGDFERENPIIKSVTDEGSSITLSGRIFDDDGRDYDENVSKEFSSGKRKLHIVVVYASYGENLYAPVGCKKVALYPISMVDEFGYFGETITIHQGECGIQVESINVCECVQIKSEDIESLKQQEKNDIILSSVPYNKISLTLFDSNETYANFVKDAGKYLRVLLYYRYNDVYSDTFLYFYDETPTTDHNSLPYKSSFAFTNVMGILNKEACHNTSDGIVKHGIVGDFEKNINEDTEDIDGVVHPSYLKEIVRDFNTNYEISSEIHGSPTSAYGGMFLKLESSFPARVPDGVISWTETTIDGYTQADALRLLINAIGHGMKVKNETIIEAPIDYLVEDSGAVFTNREYLSAPEVTEYGDIGVVKVDSFYSKKENTDDAKHVYSFEIDMSCDGTYGKDVGGDFIRFKNLYMDRSISKDSFRWAYSNTGDFYGSLRVYHSGSVVTVIWNDNHVDLQTAKIKIYIFGDQLKTENKTVETVGFGRSSNTLELSNPFIRPNAYRENDGAQDFYARFNYEYQANKRIYALEIRGRFDVHPLDLVLYHTLDGDLRKGIVIEHNLTYDGAMKSSYRVIDEGDADALYCTDFKTICSETLICR